jgi:hypothetical protein
MQALRGIQGIAPTHTLSLGKDLQYFIAVVFILGSMKY